MDTTTTATGTTSLAAEVYATEDSTDLQREAIAELVRLHNMACHVRTAMDFCVERCRLEDMLLNGLNVEATIAYAARAKCSLMDAREYIARVLAERAARSVVSEPTTH